MDLCIDCGNSNIKAGIFAGSELVDYKILGSDGMAEIAGLVHTYKIHRSIICDTRGIYNEIADLMKLHTDYFNFDETTKIPIVNLYKTPKSLGKDRLAAIIGAYMLFGKKSHLVIDAGSCITYDYIDRDGKYHGGNIAPGIDMKFRAINDFTGNLPLVKKDLPGDDLGKSTEEAIQNGVVLGTLFEIDSFIQWMKIKDPVVNTILTGGDAIFLSNNLKTKIFVAPNLVVQGLNEILKFNAI